MQAAQDALPAGNATIQSEEQQADVAQLVEQLIRNQQVVSSSLTVGSTFPNQACEMGRQGPTGLCPGSSETKRLLLHDR